MMKAGTKCGYDAWLHWTVVSLCNLNCSYCFNFDKAEKEYGPSADITDIEIAPLMDTLDKTGKVFRINLLGGEPFLVPNIIEACMELTKRHYISFNTNLTSDRFKEFSERIDPKRVIKIHASLHIKELERRNLIGRYVDNFLSLKRKGFAICAMEVAHPSYLAEVDKYRGFFRKKGITLQFSPFIGEYHGKRYPESYTAKELKVFRMGKENRDIYRQKGKLCNAGYNNMLILKNGDAVRCDMIHEKMGNIYTGLKFSSHLIRCPVERCGCPIKYYDKPLFEKALKETGE